MKSFQKCSSLGIFVRTSFDQKAVIYVFLKNQIPFNGGFTLLQSFGGTNETHRSFRVRREYLRIVTVYRRPGVVFTLIYGSVLRLTGSRFDSRKTGSDAQETKAGFPEENFLSVQIKL